MKPKQRIVAEISRNWPDPNLMDTGKLGKPLICQTFEKVIAANAERGYELESWQLSQVKTDRFSMIETIIAVFVKVEA